MRAVSGTTVLAGEGSHRLPDGPDGRPDSWVRYQDLVTLTAGSGRAQTSGHPAVHTDLMAATVRHAGEQQKSSS